MHMNEPSNLFRFTDKVLRTFDEHQYAYNMNYEYGELQNKNQVCTHSMSPSKIVEVEGIHIFVDVAWSDGVACVTGMAIYDNIQNTSWTKQLKTASATQAESTTLLLAARLVV